MLKWRNINKKNNSIMDGDYIHPFSVENWALWKIYIFMNLKGKKI